MTEEEQRDYLANGYTLQVASNGPRGAPHWRPCGTRSTTRG